MDSFEDIDSLKAQGRWLEAATIYAASVESEIGSVPRWVQLAHMLKEGGAIADAEYAYRSAIEADGTECDPRLHLAHLLKRQGRLDEALAEFEALAALPNAPNVSQEIAGMHVALHPQNRQTQIPAVTAPHPAKDVGPHVAAVQHLKER